MTLTPKTTSLSVIGNTPKNRARTSVRLKRKRTSGGCLAQSAAICRCAAELASELFSVTCTVSSDVACGSSSAESTSVPSARYVVRSAGAGFSGSRYLRAIAQDAGAGRDGEKKEKKREKEGKKMGLASARPQIRN